MALVWNIFERAARAMAELQRVSDLPICTVSQVTVGETDRIQHAKGREVAARIVEAWTKRQGVVTAGG